MNALFYLVRTNIKGMIRKMRRKPAQLILVVFVIVMFALAMFANNIDDQPLENIVPYEYMPAVFALIILIVAWFTMDNGIKKGSSSYRMADVFFVFPSPLSPRLILIYGFLRQFFISILVVLWLGFQSYNLRRFFGLSQSGLMQFYLIAFLVVTYMPIVSMLLYSTTLRREGSKQWLTRITKGGFLLVGLAIVISVVSTGDPIKGVISVIGQDWFVYIPVFGWFVALLKAAVVGYNTYAYIALGLTIGFLAFMLYRLLKSEIPFYEEVLKLTEEKEKLRQIKKSGKTNVSLGFKAKREATIKYKGSGAKAIFYRQMLEYKKTRFIFVDQATLIMLALGIIGSYILNMTETGHEVIMYFAVYLSFIFSFSGKWVKELSSYYIYMIPDKAFSKIWYATAANHIKHVVDSMALFVPAMIIMNLSIPETLVSMFVFVTISALYVYADVLFRRIFGNISKGIGAGFLKLFSVMILVLPAIIAYIVLSMLSNSDVVLLLGQIGVGLYCIGISLLVMLLSKGLFEKVEFA